MNKFTYDNIILKDSFGFSIAIAIGIIIYLVSDLSDTPRYVSFLVAAIIAIFPYIYLAYFEKDESVIKKWLPKSAMTFFQLLFNSY